MVKTNHILGTEPMFGWKQLYLQLIRFNEIEDQYVYFQIKDIYFLYGKLFLNILFSQKVDSIFDEDYL